MRNALLALSLGFLIVLAPMSALAEGAIGLLVEPAVTYEKSDSSVSLPSPINDTSGHIDGFGVGARVGFHISEIIFAGLDARYSMPNFKDSSGYDAKATAFNYGPVVGVQTPVVGLRVWGTYVLGGQMEPEKSGLVDVKFDQASGYRVGVGFYVTVVSLNLEYQELKYGSTTIQALGPINPNADTSNASLRNKTWIASVSFPIEL